MHPHRSSALGYASAASAAHSRVYGACAAEAAASESSGLSVGGCIRAWRYFGPYPVRITQFYAVSSAPSANHPFTPRAEGSFSFLCNTKPSAEGFASLFFLAPHTDAQRSIFAHAREARGVVVS